MADTSQENMARLLEVMARLRDPDSGCPWDVEQTFETIAPYTIEEAYEVADAIEAGNMPELREELGDLLFQVVFHARMAEEAGHFTFDDIVTAICEKMIRRHPHVFGDAQVADATAQSHAWEAHKATERAEKRSAAEKTSLLDDVPRALPALTRAQKLQKRAARAGFDWPETDQILDKLHEELGELAAELTPDTGAAPERLTEEFGDILFVYVNLARRLGVDPETALRQTNSKFERRFKKIEELLFKEGKTPEDSSLEEMDALWNSVKAAEKTPRREEE